MAHLAGASVSYGHITSLFITHNYVNNVIALPEYGWRRGFYGRKLTNTAKYKNTDLSVFHLKDTQ